MTTILVVAVWLFAVAGAYVWLSGAPIRRMSSEALHKAAFSIPDEYFSFIGENLPSVLRYKAIAGSRDARAMYSEWNTLARDFHMAELPAGHKGRPLLMDYFGDVRRCAKELVRRAS